MTAPAQTTARHPRWPYVLAPILYALLVSVGPLHSWYALVEHGNAPDANIGYELGFFWAAGWGLPWSLWLWFNPPASDVAEVAAYVACGLVNVALIAVMMVCCVVGLLPTTEVGRKPLESLVAPTD